MKNQRHFKLDNGASTFLDHHLHKLWLNLFFQDFFKQNKSDYFGLKDLTLFIMAPAHIGGAQLCGLLVSIRAIQGQE